MVKRIDLSSARADYIIVDPVGRRLYGLGDKVIDVDRDTVLGSVEGGGGGCAIASEQNRGIVRDGTVFDLKTLAVKLTFWGELDGRGDVCGRASRFDGLERGVNQRRVRVRVYLFGDVMGRAERTRKLADDNGTRAVLAPTGAARESPGAELGPSIRAL